MQNQEALSKIPFSSYNIDKAIIGADRCNRYKSRTSV